MCVCVGEWGGGGLRAGICVCVLLFLSGKQHKFDSLDLQICPVGSVVLFQL